MVASLLKAPILGDSVILAQYIVARQEFYLYGVCVGYRNVSNRTKTAERGPDRRARDPRRAPQGSFEIRSPGSISPDEPLSQVQQGATGLRSGLGARPPVRLSGALTMNASRIVTDHRRVCVQIHPAIAIARYRQPLGLVTFEQFELPSSAVDS